MNGIKLYSKNKSGKTLQWWAESDLTLNDEGYISLNIYYGQVDGKTQHKVRFTKSGKNLGKKNATTIEEQALLDLSYLYRAQLEDKGYFLSIEDYSKPKIAMLAHKYQDKKHLLKTKQDGITYKETIWVQPKLNGIRCTAIKTDDQTIKYVSRRNKAFTPFSHITKELLQILEIGDMIDGELFNKAMPLEYIASVVNAKEDRYVLDEQSGATIWRETDIQYHVYDYVNNDEDDATTRQEKLTNLFVNKNFNSVIRVRTEQVINLEEVQSFFAEWIQDGYEGLMLRIGSSLYEYAERSNGLMKYKEMFDEEFQVVEIFESPNEPGQPVFVVDLRNEQFCKVRKSGVKSENTKYLENPEKYIGQWLTVQYQARTEYDNLSFPVGLLLREGTFENNVFVPTV